MCYKMQVSQPKVGARIVYLVYLDEAGNTGRNLEDPQEPIHVVGAVIVRNQQWLQIEAALDKIVDDNIPTGDRHA